MKLTFAPRVRGTGRVMGNWLAIAWEDFWVMLAPYVMVGLAGVLVFVMVYLCLRNRMIRKFLGL